MRRYLRIYRTFFVSAFVREMEFRANFFAKIIQSLIWMFFFVAIILVIFGNAKTIAGWSRGDTLVLAATCFILSALTSAFFMSLMEIPTMVRLGTLDYIITKPVDTQFWVSSRRFNFDQVSLLLAGFVMLAVGIHQSSLAPNALQWLGYAALTVSGLVIFYSFNLILMTLGIWLVRVENLWVLGESIMQIARFPIDIYQAGIQRFFLFVVPLGFLATVPSRQLIVGFNSTMVSLGVVWAAFFFVGARFFWRYALRHYTSASS